MASGDETIQAVLEELDKNSLVAMLEEVTFSTTQINSVH
jgi:hypothetical protein